MIMDSKERIKYQKEMQATYEYLRANQGRLNAAGCSFYMLYHNNRKNGIAAMGAGNEQQYTEMLVTHVVAAYYDLFREKGMSLDNYFDMLKEFASGLLPAMDEIRGRTDEEV